MVFRLSSDKPDRPWVLSAAMRPLGDGVRAVGIEARHVSTKDILLALRMDEGDLDIDLPLSASVRAELSRTARCTGCRARCSPKPAPSPITARTVSI